MGWWSKDLAEKRTRYWAISRSRNCTDRAQLFTNAHKEYYYAIKAAKHQGWKDFVSKAESVKSVANIVKTLDNKLNNKKISLLRKDGQMTSKPEESLESLMSTHFIVSKKLHEHNDNIHLMALELSEETRQIVKYIDPLKTARAVNSFGPLKRRDQMVLNPSYCRCSTTF